MSILIRADGSSQIGTGHVMRCLALAQALQEAGETVIFLMATSAPALEARLSSEGIEVVHLAVELGSIEDAKETAKIAQHLKANWVVVDGYQFGAQYQQILKQARLKILFFDDYGHAEHYYADIVLNQNLSADPNWYHNRESYTQLLLGSRYVLLRKEFWQWREWQREIPTVARKILVTLGGSDPDNVTLKVIRGLQQVKQTKEIEVLVVVGGSNPHHEQLQRVCEEESSIKLVKNVKNMPELMAWADIAIAGGGSTNWELAFMRLPSIIITLADNQLEVAKKLDDMGIAINLGWHETQTGTKIAQVVSKFLVDLEQCQYMSTEARKLINGCGGQRVIKRIR